MLTSCTFEAGYLSLNEWKQEQRIQQFNKVHSALIKTYFPALWLDMHEISMGTIKINGPLIFRPSYR